MPSLDIYKKMLNGAKTSGQAHKIQSDAIMNSTWWNDISSRVGYLFDMYHDPDPHLLRGLEPFTYKDIFPIDIKYLKHTSQTYDKDHVTYHLQFRPGQKCNVPYFQQYVDMYDIEWPLGLYVLIENESGRWDRWLIVDKANTENTQFPTYEILKCDYCFQYIMENKRMEVAGVLRSQNSYNSGIWTDYRVTIVEDVQKFVIPLNRDTEKIFYTENGENLRFLIDAKVKTEPRAYTVSKVNRLSPNGLVRVTLAEKLFDANRDYIELDDDGNVIGLWADYWKHNLTPSSSDEKPLRIRSEITYSGSKPEIKLNGSAKKFTVTFYKDDEITTFQHGDWKFTIDGQDVSDVLDINTDGLDENQIKIKIKANEVYIGKTLTVAYISFTGITSSTEINIIGI